MFRALDRKHEQPSHDKSKMSVAYDLGPSPDRFDPDRSYSDHLSCDRRELAFRPFGAGPRRCIGASFARVEIQMHLMMVARETC